MCDPGSGPRSRVWTSGTVHSLAWADLGSSGSLSLKSYKDLTVAILFIPKMLLNTRNLCQHISHYIYRASTWGNQTNQYNQDSHPNLNVQTRLNIFQFCFFSGLQQSGKRNWCLGWGERPACFCFASWFAESMWGMLEGTDLLSWGFPERTLWSPRSAETIT